MMTHRERVMAALNFQPVDRLPLDLGGMLSTSISAFAYPGLVRALGLPPRLPRVVDAWQMLALPDLDVLDALDCDVVTIAYGVTNALPQPRLWRHYDFGGRLAARVRYPRRFRVEPDGTVLQRGKLRMPPGSFVFDEEHGGQPVDLQRDLPKPDLRQVRRRLARERLRDEQIVAARDLCRRVRESTDRAVFFNHSAAQNAICIHGWGGMAVFPVLCLTEPDLVAELHEMLTEANIANLSALLPEIAGYVDIIMMAADDWGTQRSTIASPQTYRKLFLPYRRRVNDVVHTLAPGVKTFLHSCGAIYGLLDLVIESGFDILNPAQWPAGGRSYQEWKDKARGRIALWGGGINAQSTLPLGSVADVAAEVREVARCLGADSGYVFCNIHNILAEVAPEKIVAMYGTARETLV